MYILSSIGGSAVPLTMAWMTELIGDNAEQRAFTAASMNTLQYTFSAWIPLVWFQQVKQPNGMSVRFPIFACVLELDADEIQ